MGRLVGVCTRILGICLVASPAGAAQGVALAVGNPDYKLISRLANPENDAALMAETLREVGFEVIEAKNADQKPGETFKDCAVCPEMVVIPPGRFRMGDLSGGGDDDEKPVHAVNIGYQFAVGKFEVTRGEFAAFQRATGRGDGGSCWTYEGGEWEDRSGRSWREPGFHQGERDPVVCVSWDDAKVYLQWIGRKAGVAYRLLSEAEWEYAARAGTGTAYNTGSSISQGEAKYGSKDGTVRVGSYSPNAFGLYDVHGNVWEWTEDCWHDSYHGAASDGGAWTTGHDCDKRVLRGGSWDLRPRHLRSANRTGYSTVNRSSNGFGFRVARTL